MFVYAQESHMKVVDHGRADRPRVGDTVLLFQIVVNVGSTGNMLGSGRNDWENIRESESWLDEERWYCTFPLYQPLVFG